MPIFVPAPVLSLDTGDEGGQAGHIARGTLQATLEGCNTSYPRETRERQQCYPQLQSTIIDVIISKGGRWECHWIYIEEN